jgi:hypothetical protein
MTNPVTGGKYGAGVVSDDNGRELRITLKDVYSAQQELTSRLTDALHGVEQTLSKLIGHLERLDVWTQTADREHSDFENRLRALERWRYALPVSVVLGLGSAVGALAAMFRH